MGGSKPQAPQFIQPPPPTITQAPAPNINESSRQLAQSQLEFNPQLARQQVALQEELAPRLTAQQVALQGQYGPQLAQQSYALQQQYGPLYRALYEQMFPTQVTGLETLGQQALQRLQSPQGLTPEQMGAQDVVRNREQDRLLRGIRTQANLGGGLYSGAREQQEREGLAELARGYTLQDIDLQRQARSQTLQELIASGQVVFPQVQQPGVPMGQAPAFGQSVTPSPDALLQAFLQGQIVQPATFSPGTPGTPGLAGPIIGAVGSLATAKMFMACLPGTTLIQTSDGDRPISIVQTGDMLSNGALVLFKSEYAPQATRFVKLILADGRWVETCDQHLVANRVAIDYQVGDQLADLLVVEKHVSLRTERTYDLLTSSLDGGYLVQGIPVATMIPMLHRLAHLFQKETTDANR